MKLNLPNKPVIIKNNDFQTIIVRVMFPFYEEEENIAKISVLPTLLSFMSNKYPTEEEFQKYRKKNYILSTGCTKTSVGTTMFLCFSMVIPDSSALSFDNFDKQFEFFSELIYNPKVVDGGFDKFEVEREKRNLYMGIENARKNPRGYQSFRLPELVDDVGIFSRNLHNHMEQIDELTPQNLYEFYLDIISKYKPCVFVFGNVDEDKINTLADKYLYKNGCENNILEKRYNHFFVPRDKVNNVVEKTKFKDSSVTFFYKVKDMSEKDFNYLKLIKGLLTSLSSRMLDKKLRDENDLVYTSYVSTYLRFGGLEIVSYINKNNKDIVCEKINEVIDELKNPDNISEYLDNIKDRRRIGLIRALDDKFTLFSDKVLELLEVDKNMNDNYQDILNISAEDISKFVERLVLDTVYFMEEDDHE